MTGASIMLAAAMSGSPLYVEPYRAFIGSEISPPPYPPNRAMVFTSEHNQAREWVGRPVIGGQPQVHPLSWGGPGPARYGAREDSFEGVNARVGNVVIGLSPWERIDGEGSLARMESARQQWLRDRGYVGGVRTFRNPKYHGPYAQEKPRASIDDDGWNVIRVPIRRPKDEPAFQVRAEDLGERVRVSTRYSQPVRVVLPEGTPEQVRVRVSERGGVIRFDGGPAVAGHDR